MLESAFHMTVAISVSESPLARTTGKNVLRWSLTSGVTSVQNVASTSVLHAASDEDQCTADAGGVSAEILPTTSTRSLRICSLTETSVFS